MYNQKASMIHAFVHKFPFSYIILLNVTDFLMIVINEKRVKH